MKIFDNTIVFRHGVILCIFLMIIIISKTDKNSK
jgi:hypothetical protein